MWGQVRHSDIVSVKCPNVGPDPEKEVTLRSLLYRRAEPAWTWAGFGSAGVSGCACSVCAWGQVRHSCAWCACAWGQVRHSDIVLAKCPNVGPDPEKDRRNVRMSDLTPKKTDPKKDPEKKATSRWLLYRRAELAYRPASSGSAGVSGCAGSGCGAGLALAVTVAGADGAAGGVNVGTFLPAETCFRRLYSASTRLP